VLEHGSAYSVTPVSIAPRRAWHPSHPGDLSLGRKYGTAAVEDALRRGPGDRVPEYRFVRRYLETPPATDTKASGSPDP